MQPSFEQNQDGPEALSTRQIVAEICRRLEWRIRPVVSHWSEPEIQRLLERMTWLKYKFEGAGALETLPRELSKTQTRPGFEDPASI